jgi:hypothetical protein
MEPEQQSINVSGTKVLGRRKSLTMLVKLMSWERLRVKIRSSYPQSREDEVKETH